MTVNAQSVRTTATTATVDGTLALAKHNPVDATSGTRTRALPTGVTPGVMLSVEKTDASTNTVVISGTIRGSVSTITLYDQFDAKEFVAETSSSWRPVSDHRTRAALDAHFGSALGSRPGCRLAALGDSITRGVYSGDSEPGIGGATVYIAGNSWLTWAAALGGGKLTRALNAGVIGDTIDMMDARVVANVCLATPRPAACVVLSGYNDAFANVTVAAFQTSLLSIIGKLRTYGIVPILATPLPTANNNTIAAWLVKYAQVVRKVAHDNGLLVLDFQAWTTDPTTGALITAVYTGGDGVHPGAAGQKWIGQKVADALTPLLALTSTPLQISPLDASNLVPNGMFTGTPTGGLAPSVFLYGSAVTGVTASIVTDAAVPGSMQRFTHASTSGQAAYAQRVNASGKWTARDWVEISGVVTTAGIAATVQVEWNVAPFNNQPLLLTQDATRAYFCARVQVPAATSGYFDLILKSGPGTGTADFGQITVRNLTVLGIA